MNDHTRNEAIDDLTTMLQNAEDRTVELNDQIMDLEAAIERADRWCKRMEGVIAAAMHGAREMREVSDEGVSMWLFADGWLGGIEKAITQRAAPDESDAAPNGRAGDEPAVKQRCKSSRVGA